MTEAIHGRLSRAREVMKDVAGSLTLMDGRIISTLITILDAMLETDTPDESVLLGRPYQPPPLFIFEEVELGGGYHTLHATHNHEEHGWSEPYKKSSHAEYRSRTVWVPYPPAAHPTDEEKASMARFGPESFRFTTGGVEYELAKFSPLGTVACTDKDLSACLAAIPDERRVPILNSALTGSFWERTQRGAESRATKAEAERADLMTKLGALSRESFHLLRGGSSQYHAGADAVFDALEDVLSAATPAAPEPDPNALPVLASKDISAHEAQRRSFAYGNAHLENPNVTREMVDKAAEELAAEDAAVATVVLRPEQRAEESFEHGRGPKWPTWKDLSDDERRRLTMMYHWGDGACYRDGAARREKAQQKVKRLREKVEESPLGFREVLALARDLEAFLQETP